MSEATFLYADYPDSSYNSSYFRIDTPRKFLEAAGHTITSGHVDDRAILSSVSETVLIERKISTAHIELLRLAGAKRIVATFDDNYGLIPQVNHETTNQVRTYWKENFNDFRKALGMCDLVIVPSKQLIKDFKKSCKRIELVQNYYDPELWKFEPPVHPQGSLKIGWGGSLQHRATWEKSNVIGGLRRLAVFFPQLVVETYGPDLRDLFDNTGINHRQFEWKTLPEWCKTVATFDIGLAPLAGEYDKRRSNLRAVEYGLARVPFVGSQMVYFGLPGGRGVLDEAENWYRGLEFFAKTPKIDIAEDGYKWAREYLIDRRIDVYTRVLWGDLK